MIDTLRHQRFLALIERFLTGDLAPAVFCAKFTRLWVQDGAAAREVQQAKKATWSQPYDELLIAAFQRGEMSAGEFQDEYARLWGYGEDLAFQTMVDALHSAYSCWRPLPELDWEIDDAQLRREVADRLAEYRASAPAQAQAV